MPRPKSWFGPNLKSCSQCLVHRAEYRQRTITRTREVCECPNCHTIVTKTNMSRHRSTISCATYVNPPTVANNPPAVVDDPPAVVDDPAAVVDVSTAYGDEYWSDGCSSN